MSSDSAENAENICVVCFKNIDIYSIGSCDHMVCYECSTRMRVLCRRNECPICRQDLPKVIFSYSLKPFSEILNSAPYEDRKYKVHFQDRKIQDAFYKLMEHVCSLCSNKSFRMFQNLSDHMRREHELYFCDLCVEHLKIFTSERRCYSKADLAHHRRKGDPDDKSHRGHPICEFCQIRFMDNDFLYRHLRKEHLFCHFCDADGHDLFYNSYDYLHDHFREEHFLCEEGACVEEKFTAVFRTEIDFKAHKMSVHGKTMGKAAAKQARTLELEFTLKPRPRPQENARFDPCLEGAVGPYEDAPPRNHSPTLDPSDFPSLPSGSGTVMVSTAPQRRGRPGAFTIQAIGRNAPLEITDENFPVLKEYNESSQGTSVRLNINQERNSSRTGSVMAPRNVSIHVNHRLNGEQNIRIRQDDFPALPSDSKSSSLPAAKWVSVPNKKNSSNTGARQERPTKQRPLLDGDFPGLNAKFNKNLNLKSNDPLEPNYVNIRSSKGEKKNSKKASSIVIPVRDDGLDTSGASTSNQKSKVKKKKTKGNTSEERSDTAKKKDDKDKDEDKNTSQKECLSNTNSKPSAFFKGSNNNNNNNNNSNNLNLVKPLPTADDWFGDDKILKSKSGGGNKGNLDNESCTNNETNCEKSDRGKNSSSPKVDKPPEVDAPSLKSGFSSRQDSKAPPGFDHINGIAKNKDLSKPPPGFSFDFPNSNGLTFTNSSGQSFAIPTSYNYTPPLNFEKRNKILVAKVFHILSDDSNLEQFKRMSALFRQDMLTADDYCNHCIRTMGEEGFQEIFPELLILLPDISKQQELFRVFSCSPKFDAEKTRLKICETCCQVLCDTDVKEHAAQHTLQENFPLLMPNTWT